MSKLDPPSVSVVVLNWNGASDTLACLDSLASLKYPAFDVIVVDNGSTDDSLTRLRPYAAPFPFTLIETGRNLGYAGGNNVGIKEALDAHADFVLVLNNDTVVAPDLLDELVDVAARWPEDGAYGPVILYADQPDRIWTAGEYYDLTKLGVYHLENGHAFDDSSKESATVDHLVGAALFLSADALRKTGELESLYFLVFEETDWCYRAKRKGFQCRIARGAKVWHKIGSSFGTEASPLRTYFSARNHLLFAERNLPRTALLKLLIRNFRRILPKVRYRTSDNASYLKRIFWAIHESKRNWQSHNQRAVRRALLDYLLRRFGDCPSQVRVWSREWAARQRDA